MNGNVTIGALLIFSLWIVFAYALAQRRLRNTYAKYQKDESE